MQKDKPLAGPPPSQQDPAEGSRDVIERELQRQKGDQKDNQKDRAKADVTDTEAPPLQTDVLKRAELALDAKAKAE